MRLFESRKTAELPPTPNVDQTDPDHLYPVSVFGENHVDMKHGRRLTVRHGEEARLFTKGLMGCTGVAYVGHKEVTGRTVLSLMHLDSFQVSGGRETEDTLIPKVELGHGEAVIMTPGAGESMAIKDYSLLEGLLEGRVTNPAGVAAIARELSRVVGEGNVLIIPYQYSWDNLRQQELENPALGMLEVAVAADGSYSIKAEGTEVGLTPVA